MIATAPQTPDTAPRAPAGTGGRARLRTHERLRLDAAGWGATITVSADGKRWRRRRLNPDFTSGAEYTDEHSDGAGDEAPARKRARRRLDYEPDTSSGDTPTTPAISDRESESDDDDV